MEVDLPNGSRKRSRADFEGQLNGASLEGADSETASKKIKVEDGVAVAVPSPSKASAKKPIDISALKAKLAAGKKKLEEIQQQKQIEESTATNGPSLTVIVDAASVKKTAATTQANARYQQETIDRRQKEIKKQERLLNPNQTAMPQEKDPFWDSRLKKPSFERKSRPLVFLKPGELTKKAEEQNEPIKKLQEALKKKSEYQEMKLHINEPPKRKRPVLNQTPVIEWWDCIYLKNPPPSIALQAQKMKQQNSAEISPENESMEVDQPVAQPSEVYSVIKDFEGQLKEEMITLLIDHPVLSVPVAETPLPAPRPLMLTKKETKHLRRQQRRATVAERREEEVLGLRDTEKSRVKISNMMKVFSEAVSDPTMVEQKVRQEMAIREARHHARNAERKLTPEERKEKEKAKLIEDTSLSSHVAVFRVWSLHNSKNRFKIDIEANKNLLTGAVVFSPVMAIVIVEGGPKAIARYKKIMAKRIPWKEPPPPPKTNDVTEAEEKAGGPKTRILGKEVPCEENECHLVWEGEVVKRTFQNFRFESANRGARNFLEALGVAHYWDAARNYIPPDVILE